MKIYTLALLLLLTGCHHMVMPGSGEPVYKYNPIELRYEVTHPDSKMRYNVFEDEWVYVR